MIGHGKDAARAGVEQFTPQLLFHREPAPFPKPPVQMDWGVHRADPVDQRWLWREAYLRDPAGNLLCLYCAGENRLFPPWRLTE